MSILLLKWKKKTLHFYWVYIINQRPDNDKEQFVIVRRKEGGVSVLKIYSDKRNLSGLTNVSLNPPANVALRCLIIHKSHESHISWRPVSLTHLKLCFAWRNQCLRVLILPTGTDLTWHFENSGSVCPIDFIKLNLG